MSTFLSTMETSYCNESKHHNMKQFIGAVQMYIRTRTEESASLINRQLHLISAAMDLSIFDPNTSVVCQFYVSLHELLTSLEPRSTLAWCCVNVLCNACQNPAAREQLIHTYQFIPPLSRLLGDHLNDDKKTRLLTVMQELSCGMKISWLIPHLAHLLSTLARWIGARCQGTETQIEQVTVLSLGVLVNLCYKNLPAFYTLTRCVDIKNFVRVCSKLKGAKMEVNVCKLLIILDYGNGVVPEEVFLKLIDVTFKSIREALEAKDAILLRHIVEFYLDVRNQNEKTETNSKDIIIAKYESYHTEVELLMNVVSNNSSRDACQPTPECMLVVFKFLHSLIELRLPKLLPMYPGFIQNALCWIQTELVRSEALKILRTIALHAESEGLNILEPLLSAMPIFLVGLEKIEEDVVMNIEHCRHFSSVMQLLRALLISDSTRDRVITWIGKTDEISKVFVPLIGTSSPRLRAADPNSCTPEAVSLYVHTLVLINELARFSTHWVSPLTSLLQNRQIHAIMAESLYSGNNEMKSLILGMAAYPHFPRSFVARAMHELHPLIKSETQNSDTSIVQNNLMSYPVMSIAQSEKLDENLQILKEACREKLIATCTSEVMELYEYKLSSMGHTERAAIASADAASQRCTHLQHQQAQLTAELSRTRQLLIHKQQYCEEVSKSNILLEQNNREFIDHLDVEKGRLVVLRNQVSKKDKALHERDEKVKHLLGKISSMEERLTEKEAEITAIEQSNAEFKDVIQKLEENLVRQEKNSNRKDELLKKAHSNIEHYKLMEREKGQLELEFHRVTMELSEKSRIIETITKLTHSNK